MIKFVVTTAVLATVGTAYLSSLNDMAQKVLNSGKQVFGSHARKIESLSTDGENSFVLGKEGTQEVHSAFGGTTGSTATSNTMSNATLAVTPSSEYGRNTYAVTVQANTAQAANQNPEGALNGSGPIEVEGTSPSGTVGTPTE